MSTLPMRPAADLIDPPSDGNAGHRPHLPALDGVRGLAVTLIVLYHYSSPEQVSGVAGAWCQLIRGIGWTGVDLFFVLSGFLITGILIDTKESVRYFRNFYARRSLRIFPLYYAYLVLVLLVAPIFVPKINAAERIGSDAIWYWCYLQNFAMAGYSEWPHSQYLNHLWSLAIEEQFYLLWPLIVFYCSSKRLPYVCIGLFVGCCLLRVVALYTDIPGMNTPLALYVSTPVRLDGLVLGAWLATYAASRGGLSGVRSAAWIAMLVAIVGCSTVNLVQGGFHYLQPLTAAIGFPLLAVGFTGLIALVVGQSRTMLTTLFSVAVLRAFGKYSYGAYVWHQLIAVVSRPIVRKLPAVVSVLGDTITFYLVSLPLLAFVSLASWYLYERHFLRLKRRFQ